MVAMEHAIADEQRAVTLVKYLNKRERRSGKDLIRVYKLHTVTLHETSLPTDVIYTQYELETLNEKNAKGNKEV